MKKLLLAILVAALVVPTFATHRYNVKNFCEDEVIWKFGSQSTLDSGWKHGDCGAHTVRDFAVVEAVEFDKNVKSRYDPTASLPASPDAGDAYISTATANGWTIHYLYISDGTTWAEEIPHEGQECWVNDEDHGFVYDGSAWYKSLEFPFTGTVSFSFIPPGDGAVELMGWYTKTDAAQALAKATPITASVPGYHSHWALDVSAATILPITIRVTGTSVDEATGTETGADTEDIVVAANGYYQTTKSWIDAVVFSISDAADSCTIDIYRMSYWDRGNRDFTFTGVRMEWTPDAGTWSIQLQIQEVADNGSVSDIINVTFANTDTPPRADNGEIGKYKRTDLDVFLEGSGGQGIIAAIVDQVAIEHFYVELRYNK